MKKFLRTALINIKQDKTYIYIFVFIVELLHSLNGNWPGIATGPTATFGE